MTDYAHTDHAARRRAEKADRLADVARSLGLMPYELAAASHRDQVRKAAGLPRSPSDETWNLATIALEKLALAVGGYFLCPTCSWPVLRVLTEGGQERMLDPFPRADGSVVLVEHIDGWRARVLPGGEFRDPAVTDLYRQHSRSCPASHRGRRLDVKRCTICNNPLWPPLVEADPTYTTHPTC